jgi:ankyrin repeat protein
MTKLEDQLIRAAVFGEVREAKALIARGADVNAHDHNDATPLWYAVRSGNRRIGETAVIELLLENGANPNITVSCRLTPLMNAVDRGDAKVVKLLLDSWG